MTSSSYARPQFPPEVIRHAVWLYLRFSLSYRDVQDMWAERGLDLTYETVRRWVAKFGPLFARELRKRRSRPTGRWHLDEMVVTVAGKRHWLWRAVDDEGEVLDVLVQSRRNTRAAVRLMRKLIRKLGFAPELLVTHRLGSYGAARRKLGLLARHEQGQRRNNRASLFGGWRSSAFRRSDRQSSNCPTGSCFSPESAPRPLHDGVRRMRRNDLKSVLVRP
jgi:transposase-like protein